MAERKIKSLPFRTEEKVSRTARRSGLRQGTQSNFHPWSMLERLAPIPEPLSTRYFGSRLYTTQLVHTVEVVEEEHPVQVIEFMLERLSEQATRFDSDFTSLAISPLEQDVLIPRYVGDPTRK